MSEAIRGKAKLVSLIDYGEGSIVSKTLIKMPIGGINS